MNPKLNLEGIAVMIVIALHSIKPYCRQINNRVTRGAAGGTIVFNVYDHEFFTFVLFFIVVYLFISRVYVICVLDIGQLPLQTPTFSTWLCN